MRIHTALDDIQESGKNLCLALGVFDGLHAGHREVIGCAMRAAESCGGTAGVLTFDPHPLSIMAPGKAPQLILSSREHKRLLLARMGIDRLVEIVFTPEFSRIPAEEFARQICVPPVRLVSVGEDWRFGREREGDVPLLRKAARKAGIAVEAVPAVLWQGKRVSSTRTRRAIREGDLDAAAAMLGRPHSVMGRVLRGRQLGRRMGFPTANLALGDTGKACPSSARPLLPPEGVYAAKARIIANMSAGKWLKGVANLGRKPTVSGGNALSLEVHLLDCSEELYGKTLEISFARFLRPEKKFEDLKALKAQVARDIGQVQTQ